MIKFRWFLLVFSQYFLFLFFKLQKKKREMVKLEVLFGEFVSINKSMLQVFKVCGWKIWLVIHSYIFMLKFSCKTWKETSMWNELMVQ